MRLHWTKEPFGYALRDSRGYARALITSPGSWQGFYAQILQSGLPDSGPYKTRKEAVDWLKRMCIELEHLPADCEFGELPDIPAGKRAAA